MPTVLNQRTIHGTPLGAVYIGRPSKWGNPYQIGRDGNRAAVIAQFAAYLAARPDLCAEARAELRGRDLVCWCAPLPCHGDALLRVANEMEKPMTLTRIISGGQTGADQGGLAAATQLGLQTGGTAPFGYRTDDGPNRKLLRDTYALKESLSREYAPRTAINVREADGTVVFGNADSPGSRLTIDLCIKAKKPYLLNPMAGELRAFVEEYGIQVLNVAGNRERTNPGIYERVRTLIIDAFKGERHGIVEPATVNSHRPRD